MEKNDFGNIASNTDFKFPEGFLWGAATSAHQVEGTNNNDWTECEKITMGLGLWTFLTYLLK